MNDGKEWKSLKKKSEKEELIQSFVLRLKKEHNLSVAQSQAMLCYLTNAINMKYIQSSDIYISDGEITGIDGFEMVDGKHELSIKREMQQSRHQNETAKPFELFTSKWRAYKQTNC